MCLTSIKCYVYLKLKDFSDIVSFLTGSKILTISSWSLLSESGSCNKRILSKVTVVKVSNFFLYEITYFQPYFLHRYVCLIPNCKNIFFTVLLLG